MLNSYSQNEYLPIFFLNCIEHPKAIIRAESNFPICSKFHGSYQRLSIPSLYIWFKLKSGLDGTADKRVIFLFDRLQVRFNLRSINQLEPVFSFHYDLNYSHKLHFVNRSSFADGKQVIEIGRHFAIQKNLKGLFAP
jgi:hypothetical protein